MILFPRFLFLIKWACVMCHESPGVEKARVFHLPERAGIPGHLGMGRTFWPGVCSRRGLLKWSFPVTTREGTPLRGETSPNAPRHLRRRGQCRPIDDHPDDRAGVALAWNIPTTQPTHPTSRKQPKQDGWHCKQCR